MDRLVDELALEASHLPCGVSRRSADALNILIHSPEVSCVNRASSVASPSSRRSP